MLQIIKKLSNKKISYVEEFAELGKYFDRPFKTYSSGMRSRVTFGLSMAFDFDIYLIDEVTSAGDERFRKRSRKILEKRHENSDFVMVDHNLWGLNFIVTEHYYFIMEELLNSII